MKRAQNAKHKVNFIYSLVRLLRPQQWYKNVLVFAALFFSLHLFSGSLVLKTLAGFIVLCIISSGGYVSNDLIDYVRDRTHPEKRNRPIASGAISLFSGGIIAVVLYGAGLYAAWQLGTLFFVTCVLLGSLTQLYSLWGKHVAYLDIIMISTNFVLRALAGVYLIGVTLSPWFLLVIMFLTLLFVTGKRLGDLAVLQEKAREHRPVFASYTRETLIALEHTSLSALVIFYGLYAYFSQHVALFALYPVYLFILLRFTHLATSGSDGVRNFETLFTKNRDWPLLIGSFIFVIGITAVYYAFG